LSNYKLCNSYSLYYRYIQIGLAIEFQVFFSGQCNDNKLKYCWRQIHEQRCSTWVQDLDSSPVFWDLDLRPVDSVLDLVLRLMDLDLIHPDLNLFSRYFLHFSLMENPNSQSEILNHPLWKLIRAFPIGSSLFLKNMWYWINLMVYQCYYVSNQ